MFYGNLAKLPLTVIEEVWVLKALRKMTEKLTKAKLVVMKEETI